MTATDLSRALEAPGPAAPAFLAGGGELGVLMRGLDWSATPLGPSEGWPRGLRTAVRTMRTSRQPIWNGRRPGLSCPHNDGCKSIIGGKHSWAPGRPTSEAWREIREDGMRGPILEVLSGSDGIYVEERLLVMERNGYPEETYCTCSFSLIPDDEGCPRPLAEALAGDDALVLHGLAGRFEAGLPCGAWPRPALAAALLPVPDLAACRALGERAHVAAPVFRARGAALRPFRPALRLVRGGPRPRGRRAHLRRPGGRPRGPRPAQERGLRLPHPRDIERLHQAPRPGGRPRFMSGGGQRVAEARGFGTRLTGQGLAAELGGEVDLDFHATGVVCHLVAPLDGERRDDV